MTDEPQMMDEPQEPSIKSNMKERSTWLRGLYMLLFVLIYGIAEFLVLAVVLFQFISMVVVRRTNERLIQFGSELSTFIYETMLFLTYNSEHKPFPFDRWPAETGAITVIDETG